MKKLISAIILLAMLLSVAAPALAASKIYATGSANIRSGPGLDYEKIGTVKKGAELTSKDKTSTDERGVKWYKVSYKGKTGWISSKYASTKKSSSSSSSSSSSGGTVYATGSVNLRTGPGLDYGKLGSVEKGAKLTYKGKTSTDSRGVKWYKVSFNGKTAWISSKYSSFKKPSSSSSSSSSSTKSSGNTVTTTGSVHLRTGPGLGFAKLGAVDKGVKLTYKGETSTDERGVKWYRVSYNGGSAWVSSKYAKLSGSSSSSKENAKTVYATASLNVRSGPGTDYSVIGGVQQGAKLSFLGETRKDSNGGKWYKIKYGGKTGWVAGSYISTKKVSVSATATPEAQTELDPNATETPAPGTPDLTDDIFANQLVATGVTVAPAEYVEVSDYFLSKLIDAAVGLQVTDYRKEDSELPNQYYNDSIIIAGTDNVDYISLRGEGYTLFGVCVGMDIEAAKAILTAAGMSPVERPWVTAFEHPANEKSYISNNGFDSSIDLYTDANGAITEIAWSAYTR